VNTFAPRQPAAVLRERRVVSDAAASVSKSIATAIWRQPTLT
jgi:hypothetical protein